METISEDERESVFVSFLGTRSLAPPPAALARGHTVRRTRRVR